MSFSQLSVIPSTCPIPTTPTTTLGTTPWGSATAQESNESSFWNKEQQKKETRSTDMGLH